jgi:hypothetical protein
MAMTLFMTMSLALALVQGNPMDQTRTAYNECLTKFTNDSLDEGLSSRDFAKAAIEACPDEKTQFVDVIVKSEMQYGGQASEARTYANEEAQMIIDSFTVQFDDLKMRNARMVTSG